MIKNSTEVERARRQYEREHPLTLKQKYALLNAMYEEVVQVGRLKAKGDRMEHKLAIARILNASV
jgi:hypothetical protein